MSNKFYCDICGAEIEMTGFGGSFTRIRPNVEHFKDPTNNPQIIKEQKDLCEKCCAIIDKVIDEQIKKIADK